MNDEKKYQEYLLKQLESTIQYSRFIQALNILFCEDSFKNNYINTYNSDFKYMDMRTTGVMTDSNSYYQLFDVYYDKYQFNFSVYLNLRNFIEISGYIDHRSGILLFDSDNSLQFHFYSKNQNFDITIDILQKRLDLDIASNDIL